MSKLIDKPNSTIHDLHSNPMISALLAQLPIGVIVASRDGQLVCANDIAATLRNGPAEPLRWVIARALLTDEVIRDEEVEYIDANDEPRTLSVSATPVADVVLVTFADITAHKRGLEWEPLVRSLSRL